MAIYHFSGQIISRSQGRSSVAASAYRSGERLHDEKTGLTHDFSKKEHDVFFKEVILPEGAPEWMKDREQLWNHVEQMEKRKDAQLCREMNIALPKELTEKQNIDLAKAFVQENFTAKGMVADLCLHRGHGEEQPHIHVMLSTREINTDGFGQKAREWNSKALLCEWREAWAEVCNQHLAMHGHDMRIDHRTLEAQGISLDPQNKIGPKEAQERLAKLEEHQAIARKNGEKILANPRIALDAITQQQSTFTHQDVARFANRHSAESEQFTRVYEAIKNAPELVHLGQDEKGRERYTTQSMHALENKLMEQSVTKAGEAHHPVDIAHKVNALNQRSLSDEQQNTFKHIVEGGDVVCAVGFAGTGKSYLLGAAKEAWEAQGYRVQGATLSGIAAENLEGGSGIQSYTIANRIINWENGRERLNSGDVLVIDEAGMVGSQQMAAIMNEAVQSGAKVVLIGDPQQLQAIDAGAAFRAISERVGFSSLTEIRRQEVPWQQEATKQLATCQTKEAVAAYAERQNVHAFDTRGAAIKAMAEQWQESRSSEPDKTQIMLAYTREDVKKLNEHAREARQSNGELGKESHRVETANGPREFSTNDRVYFGRNDKDAGVKNGTLGTIEKIEEGKFSIKCDSQNPAQAKTVTFHIKDYPHIDHGYAATVHKSQGVTVDKSAVLASPHFDNHTAYVALTRHRENAQVFYSKEDFKSLSHLQSGFSRERLKDTTLDYPRIQKGQGYERNQNPLQERTKEQDAKREQQAKSSGHPGSQDTLAWREAMQDNKPVAFKGENDWLAQYDLKQGKSPEEAISQYQELEARIEKLSPHMDCDHLRKDLAEKAHELQGDRQAMTTLREKDPELAERVQSTAALRDTKEQTRSQEKDRDMGREIER